MTNEVTNRFSDRVDNYVKYRPHYPAEVFYFLEAEKVLCKDFIVADIGSGTGISAEPLLKRGYTVYGIEPNKEMREAAENILKEYKNFKSIGTTAENTSLGNNSINTIIAGQAFHWFDKEKTKTEFKRVLKPEGFVVLMWNDRRTDTTDFLKVYEDFLQMFGTDYKEVNHKNTQDKKIFGAFFGDDGFKEKSFYNYQDVDFTGLKGRVLSSSYMPGEGHKDYDFMISTLKKIFMRYQENGKVRLDYDTKIYYGQLS
ncbi:MAG TPA: class I SAM-dependent methyltransferase [Bacteroidia bacterium]|jgi:ubiquinone/menaquinone biosynthesis C-methylase UbiE|nr:class I SAM-dependent methyltransferase [Bacteroidia bacterium]